MFQIRLWFPGVFTRRVVPPFDEELHLPVSFPMSDDRFHFPFFFSFDKVRWWEEIVRAVRVVLLVRGEKAGVEYGVDFPLGREVLLLVWTERTHTIRSDIYLLCLVVLYSGFIG